MKRRPKPRQPSEAAIDEAVAESFPCSDPPALSLEAIHVPADAGRSAGRSRVSEPASPRADDPARHEPRQPHAVER